MLSSFCITVLCQDGIQIISLTRVQVAQGTIDDGIVWWAHALVGLFFLFFLHFVEKEIHIFFNEFSSSPLKYSGISDFIVACIYDSACGRSNRHKNGFRILDLNERHSCCVLYLCWGWTVYFILLQYMLAIIQEVEGVNYSEIGETVARGERVRCSYIALVWLGGV